MIEIYKPKWEGNSERRIGLAEYRLKLEGSIVEINITYKNKEGLRLYPDPFYIRKTDIFHYPTENASGTKVYVIPIADLSTSPTLEHKYVEYELDCPLCQVQMKQTLHKHTVSYKCPKCNKFSPIQWEVATETLKSVDKDPIVPVHSEVETQSNFNL